MFIKTKSIIFTLMILGLTKSLLLATCPTEIQFQHNCYGAIANVCTPSSVCLHTPRFWCLSCSATANNNSYISWWQNYSGNIW